MSARRTVTFTVDDFEYEEILVYARAKGHGGLHPASALAHYSIFQHMAKYPLSAAQKGRYGSKCASGHKDARAVQPDATVGN